MITDEQGNESNAVKGFPVQIQRAEGLLAAPTVAYYGLAATGRLEGDEFVIVAATPERLQRIWSALIPEVAINPAKVQSVAIAPRSQVEPGFAPTPRVQEVRHCQNGDVDVCFAGMLDGICCPSDSCDVDDGVRPVAAVQIGPVDV